MRVYTRMMEGTGQEQELSGYRNSFSPSTMNSNKRFDFAERCWSGKRQAFGLVQSDPLIDRLA